MTRNNQESRLNKIIDMILLAQDHAKHEYTRARLRRIQDDVNSLKSDMISRREIN